MSSGKKKHNVKIDVTYVLVHDVRAREVQPLEDKRRRRRRSLSVSPPEPFVTLIRRFGTSCGSESSTTEPALKKDLAMKLVWGFIALFMCFYRANASTAPNIIAEPLEVNNQTFAVLSCNLTETTQPVKGSHWLLNGKVLEGSKSTAATPHTSLSLQKITVQSGGKYECVFEIDPPVKQVIEVKTPPHVSAYKHSENGDENDKTLLTCVSHGYPLPNDWNWYKTEADGSQLALANNTAKYEIKSTPNKTELTIQNLDIELDKGEYVCSGTSELGVASDRIQLRVRSRLAAVWPFLGIVAEVIILVTIIFIYEKRRKPDEIPDDDDSGSAPLKSNSDTNHKDKNVRQRNSN